MMFNCSNKRPITDNKRLNTPICGCFVTVVTTIKHLNRFFFKHMVTVSNQLLWVWALKLQNKYSKIHMTKFCLIYCMLRKESGEYDLYLKYYNIYDITRNI